MYTLELLHLSDQEGTGSSVLFAPNASAVMNALEVQDLGEDGVEDNTIRLSSGDTFIPGVFFEASAAVFGSAGIADIQIQNELGFQAIALGNHEFDRGRPCSRGLSAATPRGASTSSTGPRSTARTSAAPRFRIFRPTSSSRPTRASRRSRSRAVRPRSATWSPRPL